MVKRKVNTKRLNELVDQHGGLAEFAVKTGVSISWLQKAMAGCYEHGPRRPIRDAICSKCPIKEDDLFPLVTAKDRAS